MAAVLRLTSASWSPGGTVTSNTPFKYSSPGNNSGTIQHELRGFTVHYDARVWYLLSLNRSTQTFWSTPVRLGFGRSHGPMP